MMVQRGILLTLRGSFPEAAAVRMSGKPIRAMDLSLPSHA